MEQVLLELAKLAPVVGILAYFLWYFKGELKAKNDEIKELNKLLRDDKKDTIITLQKLTDVIGDLREMVKEFIKK